MIKIINVSTGEEIIREYTDSEKEDIRIFQAQCAEASLAEEQKNLLREQNRESARAKLAALGLTESEISALLGA